MNYLPSNRNLIRNADPEDIWVSEAAAAAQGVAERDVVRGRVALQPEAWRGRAAPGRGARPVPDVEVGGAGGA